jgi:hypothetical protein
MSIKVETDNDIIDVFVTQEMIKEAEARIEYFDKKYKHKNGVGTYRKEKNQKMTGYLAEAAVNHKFDKLKYYTEDDDRHDFISKAGITFNVKSLGCKCRPKPNFVANVYTDGKYFSEWYIFARVKYDFSVVWIAGIIPKDEFLKKAVIREKGYQGANFVYREPRFELEFNKMYKPSLLL